jgi:RNA polymerase sigma factor (sigma-70 family)
VLPHEAAVRAWLRRWTPRDQDIDDVMQEAYCRLAALADTGHISSGRAYLFQTTRNIVLEQLRHSKIARIDQVTDMASLGIADEAPQPERVAAGARELQRVAKLIEQLPRKCREVFILRRIHGVSQREIALTLGISENIVEKQAIRGLKLILKALEGDEVAEESRGEAADGRTRDSTRGR